MAVPRQGAAQPEEEQQQLLREPEMARLVRAALHRLLAQLAADLQAEVHLREGRHRGEGARQQEAEDTGTDTQDTDCPIAAAGAAGAMHLEEAVVLGQEQVPGLERVPAKRQEALRLVHLSPTVSFRRGRTSRQRGRSVFRSRHREEQWIPRPCERNTHHVHVAPLCRN